MMSTRHKRITPYFIGFFLFVLYTVAVPVETKAATCSDVDPGSVEFTYSKADGKTLTYNFTEVYSCPDCFDEETHTWTLKDEDGYTVFSGYGKTVEVFFEEEGEYTMTLTASYSFTTKDGNGDDFTCHSTQEAKQTIKITDHTVYLSVMVDGAISQSGESKEYYTITPTPEKITDFYYAYAHGTSVTLTAVPDEENNFTEWVVASDTETYSSKENPLTITLNKDATEVYAYFNKAGKLTLFEGYENPTWKTVTPGGKPFVAEHIQLSLESESSANISSIKFKFYGTGNFEHIDKAILYKYMGCSTGSGSGSGYGDKANHDSTETHSEVLNEDYLTEIAEAEIASDGSMVFSLSEIIEPGNTCYILKYLFKYDGKFGSGFTSGESDRWCESPTFGATISTEDIVTDGADFEETQEITGFVVPDVYYYVEYNAKKAIDRAKIVEGATSEVISVWNKPKLCEEEFTTISDEPFTIYIEGGLNIYVFSENYGNRPYIKGQGFCYGNEADKEPHLMNPVRRVYDIYKEGNEWFWTPGEEIENSYDNCCLKFAGRIKLIVTNKDNITYKDFKRDILKPLWSSSYWSKKDVTVKYFKRIDSKGASAGVVWIDTRECLEKVEELLPGEPTMTRNGRNLTVQYESE